MLTFAQIKADPNLLDPFQWEQAVGVICSRTACQKGFQRKKGKIIDVLKLNQEAFFCSRACVNRARQEQELEVRSGVLGRVCVACTTWKPLREMDAQGRARVCLKCKRRHPQQRYSLAKGRARYSGWDFTLTREEFNTLLSRPCFYCGVPPSGLDRQDTNKGYVLENVVPCCQPCNFGKNDLGVDFFLEHCRKIVGFSRCSEPKHL
jgi:hypothetical protein